MHVADHSAEDLLRRFHHELWVSGDLSTIDRHVDPDAHTAMTGFDGSTVDVLREDVGRYVAAFDEVTSEILELIVQDDRAAMWRRTSGRHVGPYGDIAPEPTHRRIKMEGVDFFTVREGRIVEMRSFWDAADVYRQFGLLADGL